MCYLCVCVPERRKSYGSRMLIDEHSYRVAHECLSIFLPRVNKDDFQGHECENNTFCEQVSTNSVVDVFLVWLGRKMVLTLLEEHENLLMSRTTDTPWCLRWSPWALLHPFRDGEVQTQKDVEKWINQSLDDQR
jgi:hypothetical protein